MVLQSSGLVRVYLGFSSSHILGTFPPKADLSSLHFASVIFVYGRSVASTRVVV